MSYTPELGNHHSILTSQKQNNSSVKEVGLWQRAEGMDTGTGGKNWEHLVINKVPGKQ
jgi:hypothetical protein